jgi:hypothetical protein
MAGNDAAELPRQLHRSDDADVVFGDGEGPRAPAATLSTTRPQNTSARGSAKGCMKLTEAPPSTQSISTAQRASICVAVTVERRRMAVISSPGTWAAIR